MKLCYEGLKEIGVDADEIWKKMLGSRVNIGFLPFLLIISCKMKSCYEGFARNWNWCLWDMKENIRF